MPDTKTDIEALKRELERRSQDTIIVFNPTRQTRKVIWNRFIHVVKPQEEAVLPRYIAEKYVREMVDFLILDKNSERVKIENERRIRAGMKVMDAQEREVFDWRTNNAELRKQYVPMVYRGVAEEYGKYTESAPTLEQAPTTTTDEDIIGKIDREAELRKQQQKEELVTTEELTLEKKKREMVAKVAK